MDGVVDRRTRKGYFISVVVFVGLLWVEFPAMISVCGLDLDSVCLPVCALQNTHMFYFDFITTLFVVLFDIFFSFFDFVSSDLGFSTMVLFFIDTLFLFIPNTCYGYITISERFM
jgi:hypothetical protein